MAKLIIRDASLDDAREAFGDARYKDGARIADSRFEFGSCGDKVVESDDASVDVSALSGLLADAWDGAYVIRAGRAVYLEE